MSQQASLFGPRPTRRQTLDLPDADVWFEPAFLYATEAATCFERLRTGLP